MNDFFDKLGYAAKRAAKNVANEVNVAAKSSSSATATGIWASCATRP